MNRQFSIATRTDLAMCCIIKPPEEFAANSPSTNRNGGYSEGAAR